MRDFGTGAAKADEGDRALRVLDGELQGRAKLVRIERAMTLAIPPARALLPESGAFQLGPGAFAGGIAVEPLPAARCGDVDRAIVEGAAVVEFYGMIGVAFTGAEAVAHADDQEVADPDVDRAR